MPNMSADQSRQIAEYAVGLLLKYDKHYNSRLLNEVELQSELNRLEELARLKAEKEALEQARIEEEARKKAEKEEALAQTPVIGADGAAGVQEVRIEDFYGINGASIVYQGYHVTDSYPEAGEELQLAMSATTGNKLLILDFQIQNISGGELSVDMLGLFPKFKISVNGESEKYALSTLLLNDMKNYRGTLEAGGSANVILTLEIPELTAANITSIGVTIKDNSGSIPVMLN